MNWPMVTALVAALALLGAFIQWSVRAIVRQELEPMRREIEVLRTAVFNHVQHGEEFTEQDIRRQLGYD